MIFKQLQPYWRWIARLSLSKTATFDELWNRCIEFEEFIVDSVKRLDYQVTSQVTKFEAPVTVKL